jgi:hypothetical protein
MNLGFGRSNGHDNGHRDGPEPTVWVDATEFAEVVYESDEVLVVSVATDLAEDELLSGALMDVIATSEECDTAEAAIENLAGALDLGVRTGHGHGERYVTIMPGTPAEAAASSEAPA